MAVKCRRRLNRRAKQFKIHNKNYPKENKNIKNNIISYNCQQEILNIEIPPKNLYKNMKCGEISPYDFSEIIYNKEACEVCGLRNKNLLTLHLKFTNILKGKILLRKFEKFECICIYCHRVKHLLSILESNCSQEDLLMDLKWLKSVNNFENLNLVAYLQEVFDYNNKVNNTNTKNINQININSPNLIFDDFILTYNPKIQISCYYRYNVGIISQSEKVFREIILKDQENRKRIYKEKEGIKNNEKEFSLMVQFIEQMSKILNNIFILEYEWEIKNQNKVIGVGDLVLTDGTNFYVSEIKFLNENNLCKKTKKLEEQIERYTKLFNERKKSETYYTHNFISNFADSQIHKIYGIKYTNKDEEIRCSYCIGDSN